MKRLPWILGITLISAILVVGCSSNSSPQQTVTENPGTEVKNPTDPSDKENLTEKYIKAAEEFKLKEYTISDIPENPPSEEEFLKRYEVMEPFFAKNFEEEPVHLSHTSLVLRAASKQQASIKPENMKFSVYQELEDYVDLDYTLDLVLEKENGEKEVVPMKGVLTLVNKNDKWLVQADDFDQSAFKKLLPDTEVSK
ncbi:hypothetical protein AB4Z30_06750 [Paenibacillus sp. 2TAF8]|jgi:hypothetical protein|uniref:hypothetical protein n=1 Tax=Paenibacillus sp. 2TAF8 TaxID=3233020 RepID=UPI003F986B04